MRAYFHDKPPVNIAPPTATAEELASSAQRRESRTNPLPESSEMAHRSKRTDDFPPFAIHGGVILAAAALMIIAGCALAKAQENAPCMEIKTACAQAGFKAGAAKEGIGLMVDCIDPIMRGMPQRARATKPLPPVEATLVAACKARNPDFGQGKRAPPRSPGGNELPPPGPDEKR